MKVSIRQLNGCLSAMQVARVNPESQKSLRELIQTLIESKKDYIEISEDYPEEINFFKTTIEMSKIHTDLVKVQRHNEIPRHTIPT